MMHRGALAVLLAAAFFSTLAVPGATGVRSRLNVLVPMRDGIHLAANLYLPAAEGRYPVLLVRTPYGKEGEHDNAIFFAEQGYAVVAQDVRGRYQSDGDWYAFRHEAEDGYFSIEWAARQPWSNGQVATMGASYLAMVQWPAAARTPPALSAMIVRVGPSDLYEDVIHPGGAFSNMLSWAVSMGRRVLMRKETALVSWGSLVKHLPVVSAPGLVGFEPAFFRDWIDHPARDGYWQTLGWNDAYARIGVPVFHSGGWYDTFQRGTIENFVRMTAQAPESARRAQRLVVGPWIHGALAGPRPDADKAFGAASAYELREKELRWLDHYVRGAANGVDREPRVEVFTMGRNVWRSFREWPPSDATTARLFLRSGGGARTLDGDGRLSREGPGDDRPDTFRYDPADPVPTDGTGTCCEPNANPGPVDQRAVERRPDVLVYSTPPLDQPLEVTGPVQLRLFAATSARDTDWTAKLVDVGLDGYARNVTAGIVRARFRSSFERPALLEPAQPHEFTIDLGHTSNVFLRGHRIRLEVSSSSFPRYSRNTNTGNVPEVDASFIQAEQTVYHDRARPSQLTLHVRP
jgi:uncharacterized protein